MVALTYPNATLDKAGLDFHARTSWALQVGVDPVIKTIEMDAKEMEKIIERGGPMKLTLDYGERKLEVEDLYPIGASPTSDSFSSALLLSDNRIWWKRRHIVRRYNIRTRSGDRRRLDADGEIPQQLAAIADDVTYKRESLRNKDKPWTAREMVEDVLDTVAPGWSGNLGQFTQKTVDHVELDDTHDVALARVLSYLPGAACFVNLKGQLVIINTMDVEATDRMLQKVDPVFQGGHPVLVDLTNQRPELIRCLLSVEQEVRFDSYRASETVTKETRFCENVIPVPDPDLYLIGGDGSVGRRVVQGTWVTIEEILRAWNAQKGGRDVPDITIEEINKWWLTNILEMLYTEVGKVTPSVDWVRRIRALRQHYRQTYRISRWWIDKIISFQNKRVSLLDFETGQRAQSYVYTDYTVMTTFRGGYANGVAQNAMQSIKGSVDPGQPLSAGESSEATLTIEDQELGIVRVGLEKDLLGHVHTMIPGVVNQVPTVSPREWRTRPFYQDGTKTQGGFGVSLADKHRVSFVVTMAPAVPNNTKMLYGIEVRPSELDEYIPPAAKIGECRGPRMDLRIGPSLTTARFAWQHSKRGAIEQSMGATRDGEGSDRAAIRELLQNPDETTELARAVATSVYVGMADRWEGVKTDTLNPELEPRGTMTRVEWQMLEDGSAFTVVSLPPDMKGPDPLALMPTSVRRTLLGDVQP